MATLELPVVVPAQPNRSAGTPTAPRVRPPFVARLGIGLLSVGAMSAAVALLLSDRAPGALRALFGERARRLWERIDASERVDLPPGSELPSTDFLVHVAIWAVVAGLVGLAVWTWRGLAISAGVLAGASALLELAQGWFADTRAVEASDAVGNLIGIGLGLTAAAGCFIVWSTVAAIVSRSRDRRRNGRPVDAPRARQ